VYPSSHYVTPRETVLRAIEAIKLELRERIEAFQAGRASWSRPSASSSAPDSTWRCSTNWASARASRTTRATSPAARPGEPPPTLIDYLAPDALMFIDESHVTIPQLGGMYKGDRSRKENLVELRIPPAVGPRQPAAQVRRVREAVPPDRLRFGHPGGVRADPSRRWWSRWCGPPAWSTPR
jgi:excinuclease ABC subunit B